MQKKKKKEIRFLVDVARLMDVSERNVPRCSLIFLFFHL